MQIEFSAKLWEYAGEGAWHFITVPTQFAADLREIGEAHTRGFGSIRVQARIGSTTWQTSLFPDAKSKSYLLPIKKEIRQQESLLAGSLVQVELALYV
jgi:hypothetical protein